MLALALTLNPINMQSINGSINQSTSQVNRSTDQIPHGALTTAVNVFPSHRTQAEMDRLFGPNATAYLSPPAFEEHERLCREGGLGVFDAMATMGRRSEVLRVRTILVEELDDAKARCVLALGNYGGRGVEEAGLAGGHLRPVLLRI